MIHIHTGNIRQSRSIIRVACEFQCERLNVNCMDIHQLVTSNSGYIIVTYVDAQSEDARTVQCSCYWGTVLSGRTFPGGQCYDYCNELVETDNYAFHD